MIRLHTGAPWRHAALSHITRFFALIGFRSIRLPREAFWFGKLTICLWMANEHFPRSNRFHTDVIIAKNVFLLLIVVF